MAYNVKISGGRDMNKPTEPKNIKAGKTMRRVHSGGTHKAVHKSQPEGSRTHRGISETHSA